MKKKKYFLPRNLVINELNSVSTAAFGIMKIILILKIITAPATLAAGGSNKPPGGGEGGPLQTG